MARYKIIWNNILDVYEVWDRQSSLNPTSKPECVGKITEEALSMLVTKMVLHSNKTCSNLSDSFMQLADEVSQDFQEYVAILAGHKQKEVSNLQDSVAEMANTLVQAANLAASKFDKLLSDIEETRAILPKAITVPINEE